MAYIDIYPQFVSSPGNWSSPEAALTLSGVGDGNYAYKTPPSSGEARLLLYGPNQNLPANSTIDGIQVFITAKVSASGGTPALATYLINDLTGTAISSGISTSTLTTTGTVYTVGSSGSTTSWGSPTYYQLNTPYLGVSIAPTGDLTKTFMVDTVVMRIYYTAKTYLVGTRSQFTGKPGTLVDSISRVENGIGVSHQVKSEQCNLLGDCLYNIEQGVIQMPNVQTVSVYSGLGYPSVMMYAITVTGVLASSVPYLYQEKSLTIYGRERDAKPSEFGSIARSPLSLAGQNFLQFNHVRGVGWVTSGGVTTPLVVSANVHWVDGRLNAPGYWLSWSAFGSGYITASTDVNRATEMNWPGVDITSMASVPGGNVTIKLFAMARAPSTG